MAATALYPLAASKIANPGVPVTAAYGPLAGGAITNPQWAADQGLPRVEVLYVDVTGPAALGETETTLAIQPGQTFKIPPGQTTDVSVNAASAGHAFAGYVLQPPTPYPPTPQPGNFPPTGPTTLTALGGMASYLYEQYQDDDDLQAFVSSFNELAQIYVGWFATTLLPVYTSDAISGSLLDWVAAGIYGMFRPSLSSGKNRDLGPLNTYGLNEIALNVRKTIGPINVTVASDDVFKRIMTWNFYKGDGNLFNARWIKRRIMRFLLGVNGTAPNVDQTYDVSVTFGPGIISIAITVGTRSIVGGALCNRFGCNEMACNAISTRFNPAPMQYALEPVLKQAIESGVLTFPFQYQVFISI